MDDRKKLKFSVVVRYSRLNKAQIRSARKYHGKLLFVQPQ